MLHLNAQRTIQQKYKTHCNTYNHFITNQLGSAPRIHFGDKDQYNQDADQNGSWFGLAITGLKFLISNQNNHNVNHNLNPQFSEQTNIHTNSNPYPFRLFSAIKIKCVNHCNINRHI